MYFQGCDVKDVCNGCHNKDLIKKPKRNIDVSKLINELEEEIKNAMYFNDELYLSFLGGEPLTKYNRVYLYKVSKYFKEKYNSINVLYTWRKVNDIKEGEIEKYVKYIDFGVLGKYEKNKKIDNVLPSSSNQIIYDFKKSVELQPIKLKQGDV